MTCSCPSELRLARGTTLTIPYRYGAPPLVYKTIAAKVSDTPLALTVTAHGLPAAWSVAFTDVGYDDLNAKAWPPKDADWLEATATDVDTLVFNDVDLARLEGDWADGSIAYMSPVDLASGSARFDVLNADNTPAVSIAGVLDNTARTITFTFEDADSVDLTAQQYGFAAVFVDSNGQDNVLDEGTFNVYEPGFP